jgi:hypothetical protein
MKVIRYVFIFRIGEGNIRCSTIEGIYSQTALTTGYGGNAGYGALGCPTGYMGVGNVCIKFGTASAIGPDSSFFDAIANCGGTGDILYTPTDAVQNAVVRAAMAIWVNI